MILEVKNDMLTGKGTENTLHLELIKKDKEIERLNNIIDDLKQKINLAENILYDYLYNDDKITKEKYEQFKELKEGNKE